MALTAKLSADGYCVAVRWPKPPDCAVLSVCVRNNDTLTLCAPFPALFQVVNLCGFGEVGPGLAAAQPGTLRGAFDSTASHTHRSESHSTSASVNMESAVRPAALVGEGPSGLSVFTGRSLVGRHAAELARVCEHVLAQPSVSHLAALVAADHTDAALLHAIAVRVRNPTDGLVARAIPGRPVVALVDACTSWAAIGQAAYYAAPIFRTVVGALKRYDLPDLAASALYSPTLQQDEGVASTIRRLLVLGPRSALLQPLSQAQAMAEYEFVRDVGGPGLVDVVTGKLSAKDISSAIAESLRSSS